MELNFRFCPSCSFYAAAPRSCARVGSGTSSRSGGQLPGCRRRTRIRALTQHHPPLLDDSVSHTAQDQDERGAAAIRGTPTLLRPVRPFRTRILASRSTPHCFVVKST